MSISLQPLQAIKRDTSLDVLRGFALAGVLFIFCTSDIKSSANYVNSFWDELIAWPKWVLVENRMYTMLILIFGFGFGVQLQKAQQIQKSLVPVFLRRLAGLLIIGSIHALLLSKRDILIFYAIAGFALLPVRNLTNRQVLIIASVLFVFLVTPLTRMFLPSTWIGIKSLIEPNNYIDHIKFNWEYFIRFHQAYDVYIDMIFHFLLGFYISRTRFLKRLKTFSRFRWRATIISLTIAVITGLLQYAWIETKAWGIVSQMEMLWQKFSAFTALFLVWHLMLLSCVCLYASILISVSATAKRKIWFTPLAAFGQMALSNYLIQSLLLVPYLLWFDKFNNMPSLNGFILFLIVFAFQLVFSTWWLSYYNFGPFEWLLRSFTYWKWQSC